jgi:hypothetical protein
MVFHTLVNTRRVRIGLALTAMVIAVTTICVISASKSMNRNSNSNSAMQNQAAHNRAGPGQTRAHGQGRSGGFNKNAMKTQGFNYYPGGFGSSFSGYYGGSSSGGYYGGSSSGGYYGGSSSNSGSYGYGSSKSGSDSKSGSSNYGYGNYGYNSNNSNNSNNDNSYYSGGNYGYNNEETKSSSHDKALIVAVVSEKTSIPDLCDSMKTLKMLKGTDSALIPVLIIYTSDVPIPTNLSKCTKRAMTFHPTELVLPSGFTPTEGTDYSSALLNRYWTTQIWEEQVFNDYEIIMAIDDDTCFTVPDETMPYLGKHHDYHSQHFVGNHNSILFPGLFEFTEAYMKKYDLTVRNPDMWNKVLQSSNTEHSLPVFQDSFEIIRKSFMLRPDVKSFHKALTETDEFGYFTKGWTSDVERFLTAAIFGTANSIETKAVTGFIQKDLERNVRNAQACKIPFETE